MTHTILLLTALRDASRDRKAPALIALLERSSRANQIAHIISALKSCGKLTHTGFTASGRQRKGRIRCKLPICPRCQVKEGKRQSARSQALMAASESSALSLVTVNADHMDGNRFRGELVRALRGFKYSGVLSVSLTGKLHAHLSVSHDQTTRNALKEHVKAHFPQDRAVHVSHIEQEQRLDGVNQFIQYAHQPIKGRDSRRSSGAWSIEGLGTWAELNIGLTGSRKIEGGFTSEEKIKAKSIQNQFKAKPVKRRKLTSILLQSLQNRKVETSAKSDSSNISAYAIPSNSGNVKLHNTGSGMDIRSGVSVHSDLDSRSGASIHNQVDISSGSDDAHTVSPVLDSTADEIVKKIMTKIRECKKRVERPVETGSRGTTPQQTPEERTDRIVERLLSQLRKSRIDQKQGVLTG